MAICWPCGYTTHAEPGRELAVAASRLVYGRDEWQPASPFWDAPDRNDHCPILWSDGKKTLHHFNSLSAAATWGRWPSSNAPPPTTEQPGRARDSSFQTITSGHQLISSEFREPGRLDAPALRRFDRGHGGSALQISRDGGKSWFDPGGTIAGIHAGVAQLADGRLLAFGRGDDVGGMMPQSTSEDMGRHWAYTASPWPTIGGGQRLVLLKLREGPLLFVSFTDNSQNAKSPRGLSFKAADGGEYIGYGLFAALSFDEGRTWPVRKLVTAGATPRQFDGGAWTRGFTMDATHAEPRGYLAATQRRMA